MPNVKKFYKVTFSRVDIMGYFIKRKKTNLSWHEQFETKTRVHCPDRMDST